MNLTYTEDLSVSKKQNLDKRVKGKMRSRLEHKAGPDRIWFCLGVSRQSRGSLVACRARSGETPFESTPIRISPILRERLMPTQARVALVAWRARSE